jgi:WhiB family transcriptional regulator, redox-sensing transcriptional regulator
VTRRVCPDCGARWTLQLNRGAKHQAWHDDPRCGRCRKGDNTANRIPPEVTPPPARTPDLYTSLTTLLTSSPASSSPTFREPGAGRGYGTYPADRTCPKCGTEWTLLVDRPARQSLRPATCGPCRTQAAHRAHAVDLPVGDQPGPWLFDGLCTQVDTDLFFPEKGGSTREAKAVCRRCPVLAECRDWAVATDQPHGIWGGLTRAERRERNRERAAS